MVKITCSVQSAIWVDADDGRKVQRFFNKAFTEQMKKRERWRKKKKGKLTGEEGRKDDVR